MRRASSSLVRGGLILVLVLCAGVVGAQAAFAHANFQGASPQPGAHLADGPGEIFLRFNEPVMPVAVRLLDAELQPVPGAGPAEPVGNDIRLPLAGPLPDGWYLVSYRVISADAHPVAASFEFAVGDTAARPRAAAEAADAGAPTMIGRLLRPALLISLVLAAGFALFPAALGHRAGEHVRAVVAHAGSVAAWTTAALALAGFAVGGAEMTGGGWSALAALPAWRAAAGSTLGTSTLLALSGAALAGLGCRRPGDTAAARGLLLAAAVALALSRAVTGHAAAASTPVMLAMGLHVLLASFWAGALWPLWSSLQTDRPPAVRALMDAFSRLAVGTVALTVVAGVYMAWTHLGSIAALTGTAYGGWLVLKLALVAMLLGLAAANKWWLTPALARTGEAAAGRMRLSIGIEIAVMGTLLLVSATLAHTPPPGGTTSLPRAVPASLEGMVMEGDYHVTWRLTPGIAAPGGHELTLQVQRRDGTPVEPLAISASFASQALGIEPLAADMARTEAGDYVAAVRGLTAPGEWQLALDILVTDFDKLVLQTPVTLR